MAELKLGKLPDRNPVKLTISVLPDLHSALGTYAILYEQTYGQKERIEELIPAIIAGFLDSDRAFAKRWAASVERNK
jgi:hypothetical protein